MIAFEPAGPMVWLARILRPQGRKGEVFAEILTDFPNRFAERRQLWLLPPENRPAKPGQSSAPPAPSQVELTNHWLHKGGIVMHFAGVDSISAAEALKGMIVAIPRAERAELAEDEAYISDLVGCTVVDITGAVPAPVGTIADVDRNSGPVPLLVVCGPRGEVLVPFAKSYLRRFDLAGKRVEMALPEGLVDLNAPKKN